MRDLNDSVGRREEERTFLALRVPVRVVRAGLMSPRARGSLSAGCGAKLASESSF